MSATLREREREADGEGEGRRERTCNLPGYQADSKLLQSRVEAEAAAEAETLHDAH